MLSLTIAGSPPTRAAVYEVSPDHSQATDEGPGTAGRPWKTFARAAEAVKAGDTVLLHAGTYREGVTVKADGTATQPIRFIAAPGEHVVVTGADRLTMLKIDGDHPVYQAEWPHRFNTWIESMAHPNDERHVVIGRAEQVFVNGYLMRQVLDRDQLALGTFYADVDAKRLYVWGSGNEDLTKADVEASTRQTVFQAEGDHIQIKGIRFRYAANRAQQGAVLMSGDHGVMEDCIIERTNAIGATFTGKNIIVRRSTFRENGQLGFSAVRAHDLLFTDSLVEDNNTKNFSRGWEAGGNKIVLCRGVVLEKSRFLRNRGVGIWFDIGNEKCTVRNNLIRDNEDAGIFYEISYSLHAHDNVIVGNGFAVTQGAWGAQAGISLSSSPDCIIERNLIVGNREGFNFREQIRTTPTIENQKEVPVWNHDEVIRNNIFAYNQDAQVWGWFDVNDERHWPKGTAKAAGGTDSAAKPDNLAAEYVAKDERGQPTGLSLEKLNFRFANNVYVAKPHQGMIHWGVTWKRHEKYPTPAAFAKALGIETGARALLPGFADLHMLDFRVPPEVMKRIRENYPKGTVPGVNLGVLPKAKSASP
ncbi:MAG: right-handed parallel beta-helix repeat-containing protein [Armatimonadetes bacterium]|nr:right-handed parallel beta-helix repeat-containing protein [Armatimonadota bacterium]